MSDERFRGASVRNLPRPNKTYTAGRVCTEPGCETKLSIYSKWKYCWQHEPVHAFVRPWNTFGVRLRARIAPCGPPRAALVVLDPSPARPLRALPRPTA